MTWQTADLPGIADRCFLGYKRCLLSYILEMTVSLASLLMTDYRRRVLGLLLLHPDRSFHLREIARLTGTVPGTLNRELTKLTDAGLLTRERVGNQMRYAASRDCPIFEELASILRKTSGLADVLAEALSTVRGAVAVAFVYGSMARGEEVAGSDVDLMVVGGAGFRSVVTSLHAAQAILGREINAKVFLTGEWRERVAAGDPFVADVLARPKIFVVGTADELAELGGDESRRDHTIARHDRAAAGKRPPPPGRRKGRGD